MSTKHLNVLKEKVYICHEYGTIGHYYALYETNRFEPRMYVYTVFRPFVKGVMRRDYDAIKSVLKNLVFFCELLLKKRSIIILGMAPYDMRVVFFMALSGLHDIYLHTSWLRWEGKFFPKRNLIENTNCIKNLWKYFLEEQCKGVFAVSNATKISISRNYKIKSICVVKHSIRDNFFTEQKTRKEIEHRLSKKRILFLGRLEKSKGIEEFINLSVSMPNYSFGVIGNGPEKDEVVEKARFQQNLTYHGVIKDSRDLVNVMDEYAYTLNLSKLVEKPYFWEELYGISIIESMARGLFVISTNQIGPMEILDNGRYGKIVSDVESIPNLLRSYENKENMARIIEMIMSSMKYAERFEKEEIVRLWGSGLKQNYEPSRV